MGAGFFYAIFLIDNEFIVHLGEIYNKNLGKGK